MTETIVFQEPEIWRPVVSYDGVFKDAYQVSNWGRVRSVDRWIKHWRVGKRLWKGRILSQGNSGNYLKVTLHYDGYKEYPLIHQLVADAFPEICGLPFPGSELDHKNGNPHDNRPENLEYKTHKENCNNPITKERQSKAAKEAMSRPGAKEHMSNVMTNYEKYSKPVMQYTKDGQFIAEYPSQMEAFRQTGVKRSNIGQCCTGKEQHKSAGGFMWKFK